MSGWLRRQEILHMHMCAVSKVSNGSKPWMKWTLLDSTSRRMKAMQTPGCEGRLEFQWGFSQGTPEVALAQQPPGSTPGQTLHPAGHLRSWRMRLRAWNGLRRLEAPLRWVSTHRASEGQAILCLEECRVPSARLISSRAAYIESPASIIYTKKCLMCLKVEQFS